MTLPQLARKSYRQVGQAGGPLGALVGARRKRSLGVLAGKLRVPEDFDAALPDKLIEAFEGR